MSDKDFPKGRTEMPEAVQRAIDCLREAAAGIVHYHGVERKVADALEREWRTHSQPVAHPFKAGFKPDSMRHFAEYVRDNWHYFGTDTAGLAHQFLQEMAAQPVAVGMTEELEVALKAASERANFLDIHPANVEHSVASGDEIRSAIAAARRQAAQGRKVELPTARKTLEYMRRCAWADATYEQIDAALSELDAVEGRK